jgi:hypothetical protein
MRTNHVKALLNEGKPALGAWLSLPSVASVASARIMAQQRFDWLLVDMEHSAHSASLMADTEQPLKRNNAAWTTLEPTQQRLAHGRRWRGPDLGATFDGGAMPTSGSDPDACQRRR